MLTRIRSGWEKVLTTGEHEGESSDRRGRRRIIVGALALSLPPILLGALGTIGESTLGAAFAFGQLAIHLGILIAIGTWPHRFVLIVIVLNATDLAQELIVTLLLGGLYASGISIAWGLVVVFVAVIALSRRAAAVWFGLFAAAVVVSHVGRDWFPQDEVADPAAEALLNLLGVTILVFLALIYFVRQRDKLQQESDDLLRNVLPESIAERLKQQDGIIADRYETSTVLFADVVNFTPMSAGMRADEVVALLDEVFRSVDLKVVELGLEKIKTVGDEYMVAAGVPEPRPDHAGVMAELALMIRNETETREFGGHRIQFRIGMHSGPVVAGVIGDHKFAYDLWGDTVNTASRMESHGVPGEIQITRATKDLIDSIYRCEPRGSIDVKGKGPIDTWFLKGPLSAPSP